MTDTGKMVEWVKYSSYGEPLALPAGDTDSDGDWDATDSGNIAGGYDVRKDAELDGDVDASDITHANSITGGYQTLGRTVLSSTAVANRKGYAGYERDHSIGELHHVRHRVLHTTLGRWTRRDPLGYVDGGNVYAYVNGRPLQRTDRLGLFGDDWEPKDLPEWIEPITSWWDVWQKTKDLGDAFDRQGSCSKTMWLLINAPCRATQIFLEAVQCVHELSEIFGELAWAWLAAVEAVQGELCRAHDLWWIEHGWYGDQLPANPPPVPPARPRAREWEIPPCPGGWYYKNPFPGYDGPLLMILPLYCTDAFVPSRNDPIWYVERRPSQRETPTPVSGI